MLFPPWSILVQLVCGSCVDCVGTDRPRVVCIISRGFCHSACAECLRFVKQPVAVGPLCCRVN